MKNKMKKFLLILIVHLFAGCDPSPYIAPTASTGPEKGLIGNFFTGNLFSGLNIKDQSLVGQFTNTTNSRLEVGKSCIYSVLGLIAFGDAGIETAKREAKLTKVSIVEYENLLIYGVAYRKHCVNVYGSREPITSTKATPVTDPVPAAKEIPAKKTIKKK